jgi:DnaJ-class molecular chaperone
MDHRDYYSILGLDRNAGEHEIRAAYRKLAFRYHPDRNKGDHAATERMKEVNEAYAILSDAVKRREYDLLKEQYGQHASTRYRQAHSQSDIYAGSDIEEIFQEFARQFGFRDFNHIFTDSGGPGFRSFEFRGRAASGRGFVLFRSAGGGGNVTQASPESATPLPGGRLLKFLLRRVAGLELPEKGKDWTDSMNVTSRAAADGGEIEYPYRRWGKSRNLMVKIPPGTRDGQQIRLKGMGGTGKGGGEPGDLYLRVRVRTSFSRKVRNFFRRLAGRG